MDDCIKLIDDIYNRIIAVGSSVKKVCDLAGITPQTFHAWKRGDSEPLLRCYHAVLTVVCKLERENYLYENEGKQNKEGWKGQDKEYKRQVEEI